jgi:hypothetical protein
VAIRYLLPCSCGRKVPVETRQAGETTRCECGLPLEIPRLLELKRLEKAAVSEDGVRNPLVWGIGHSLVLSGMVVLVGVVLLWYLVLQNAQGDPYSRMTPDQVRAHCQKMSPLQTWQTWMYFQQNGINPRKDRFEREILGLFGQRQLLLTYLGIAGGAGAALVVGGIFLVRRKRRERPDSPK